jgi:phosphomannomutase
MTLIKSISGIRGTIGGQTDDNLTPQNIVRFTSAYATWLIGSLEKQPDKDCIRVVVGRDSRISGPMVSDILCATLISMGLDVINIGQASTPTTEMAVIMEKADGGIIITASHNPKEYNALKLLNNQGEFLNATESFRVMEIADEGVFTYQDVMNLGKMINLTNYEDIHIQAILDLPVVNVNIISQQNYTVAIDCVNSVGGIGIPKLLKALGIKKIKELYCEPTGNFPHNPEPLPENLTSISETIRNQGADVGFVVDPDVDRLAIVCEDGSMFGEEYTLVAIADFILQKRPGNTVSNMSSTRALRNVTETYDGAEYFASAVGEVNVVEKMKEVNAVIGGEGNGGVIYPELHYGRDALIGIALFLTIMAEKGKKVSEIRAEYPDYYISKNKIQLSSDTDVDAILQSMKKKYKYQPVSTLDGVKIEFNDEWVHLRKSNTEPIIRIYSESKNKERAEELAKRIMKEIENTI